MRARRVPMRARGWLAALLLLGAGCSYSPEIESGTLMCSAAGECPDGFSCSGGLCYKTSGGHGGQGGNAGRGGQGGQAGHGGSGQGGAGGSPSDATAKFLGHWLFSGPTPQAIACSDGTTMNYDLIGDYVDVVVGGTASLSAFYYCNWSLNVDPTGVKTVLVPGTSCSAQDPNLPTRTYTWRGERFTITTSNGLTGTLDASIPYDYPMSGTTISCTMTIGGTLTKGTP